ncbi:hypothetical protein C2G38_2174906 [Gigaspora rosea]|uniref:Uncharacterized protein n=1 Tax=Gigaspora rosea TaxID=44941 RepID=A0A397VHV4_9GLOM|nr:hypothetical protein C2G38_2174906 [Gigaspora rosea]
MCEVGVQVNQETHEVGIQVSDITLESRVYLLQLQLSSKINEIEDLKKQLDYAYDYVMESWERVQELSKINKEITEQNNALKCKWETRYNSQKKRIDSVIQIANQERQNVYNDIESLIFNRERFLLNNLLNFTPDNWLANCNPVIINFINTLTRNDSNNHCDYTSNEKTFKKIVAIDSIYGSRHKNYVSEISLAISGIKYSLSRSKTIVDIDNHVVSSGSYTKFVNWLESLAIESEPLPEGLLFLAFNNEQ